jgi:hypothetical protein
VKIPIGQHEGNYFGYFRTVSHSGSSDSVAVTITVNPLEDIDFDREIVALAVPPGGSSSGLAVVVNPNTWDNNPDPSDGPGNVDLTSIGYQFTDLTSGGETIPSSALSMSDNESSLGSGASDEVTINVDVPANQIAATYTGKVYVSGMAVIASTMNANFRVKPQTVKDSLTLEVTVSRAPLLNIVETSASTGVTPPDPWTEALYGDLSFQVTNTGNDVLENIVFLSTNLELTDHPPLHGKSVEFNPPMIAFLSPNDTLGVVATVPVPIGSHAGTYAGAFSATAAVIAGAADALDVDLTVDDMADMDINDYAGNLTGNVMQLIGVANSVVVGSFNLINPNMMDRNPDPFDGPGNMAIDELDANWSHLWTYGHIQKIHRNKVSFVTPLPSALPSGDAKKMIIQVDIPQTKTPREKTYSTVFEVTSEGGGADLSDEFTLRVKVVPKGDDGSVSSCFWLDVKDGETLLKWTEFSFGEVGYNLYRMDPEGTSFTRLNTTLMSELEYQDGDVLPGSVYEYKLGLVFSNGDELLVGPVAMTIPIIPRNFALHQNAPNPFNQLTAIRYQLKSPGHTSLKIYDLSGRVVRTLVNEEKEAGYYSTSWDRKNERGEELSNGIYFYRLVSSDFEATKKMIL